MDNIYEIVNGALLPQFQGKKVSIVGLVSDANPNGNSFDIRTSDNMLVKINLKTPLDRPVEGYVEVHGISNGKSVASEEFIIFENKEFNSLLYNKVCSFLYSVPNIWDCGPEHMEEEGDDL